MKLIETRKSGAGQRRVRSTAKSGPQAALVPPGDLQALEDPMHILRRCPLFEGLTGEDLRIVLQASQQQDVKKGGFYFQQGDRATTLHVLLRGSVKQLRVGPDGRQVILRFISPAEPFGFDAMLDAGLRRVAAQAAEDSQGVAWEVATLAKLMMQYPAISLNSGRLVVKRLIEVWDRLWDLSIEHVERRIARALLRLKPSSRPTVDRSLAIDLALSHQDLADLVGTTPYTVSRILRRWTRLGLVRTGRGSVRILWPHRLAAIAEDQWPLVESHEYFP